MGFDRVPVGFKEKKQKNEILSVCLRKRTAELPCGKLFCCDCEVSSIIIKDEKEFLRNCLSLSQTT